MRMVVNAWLRPGNTGSASRLHQFLYETLDILHTKKVGLIRADSGFYGNNCLNYFERRSLKYIFAAKLNKPLKWELIGPKNWISLTRGIQVCEFWYHAHGWSPAGRYIAVLQQIDIRPKATGKKLFTEEELGGRYRYSAFVTDYDLSADQIWMLYRNRAEAENRIKEL
jgi:hypothetical protein